MIQVRNLSLSFSGSPVLNNLSFDVPEKSIQVVLGKNGAGKSVLLKCISGLIPADSGTVSVGGIAAGRDLYFSDSANAQTRIAYVFQKGGLFDSMNVFENAAFGMRRKNLTEECIRDKVMSVIARVGLSGAEEKLPSELSGGMQKRVGLARALCLEPLYIMYDDPTAGLDPVLTDSIADMLLEIRDRDGITSIVVTHDVKFAGKISDSMAILYEGSFVFSGGKEEFFSKNNPFSQQFVDGSLEGPINIY